MFSSFRQWTANATTKVLNQGSVARLPRHTIQYSFDVSTKFPIPYYLPSTSSKIDTTLPILLIVHGSPGGFDSARWHASGLSTFAPHHLKQKPFGIITFARPGYLNSQPPCPTFDEEASVINDFLNHIGVGDKSKVAVMAVSGSGPVALTLRKDYPSRVSGLLMFDTITKRIPFGAKGKGMAALLGGTNAISNPLSWMINQQWHPEVLYKLKMMGSDAADEIKADPIVEKMFRDYLLCYTLGSHRRQGMLSDLTLIEKLDVEPDWGQIDVPLLCMHGEKDDSVTMEHAEHIMRCAEKSGKAVRQLHAFPDGMHILPLKRTSELAVQFLWDHVFPKH
ncbi:hypothetical protein HK097_008495 [Rhizophlyctis rosea]|uniref:Peptidase S9 prolyl oligopeptidase catalytic domain-containing protein n=1 Tax=Rhizophlyctis rosea TaxID=64517 RepID=A0AAD5X5H1_9FUNG|nr:hypothetical protein HK097_008495 [Rhizophlyctis rosea]